MEEIRGFLQVPSKEYRWLTLKGPKLLNGLQRGFLKATFGVRVARRQDFLLIGCWQPDRAVIQES